MGMRGTIGYIDTDSTMKLTMVQWSTMLDRTIGVLAANSIRNGEDPVEAVRALVKDVTNRFFHISALETVSDEEDGNNVDEVVLSHGIYAHAPAEREGEFADVGVYGVDSVDNHRELAHDYHLNGQSIGLVVDANSDNENIEFFYDNNETDEFETNMLSVHDLADFYANDYIEDDLMDLSFR